MPAWHAAPAPLREFLPQVIRRRPFPEFRRNRSWIVPHPQRAPREGAKSIGLTRRPKRR